MKCCVLCLGDNGSRSGKIYRRLRGLFICFLLLGIYLNIPVHCPLDAIFEGNLRVVSKQVLGLGHIGTGVWNISGLVGKDLDDGLLANIFLNQVDEFLQGSTVTLAEVEDLVGIRPVNGADDTVDNVGNVGVVAAGGTVSVLLHFNTTVDAVGEFEWRHVGSSSWSVDGEESESSDIQLVQVVVGVGQQFASFLGSSIRADGVVDHFVFGEKGGLGSTVDRRRRSKDKVLDAVLVGQFHQVRCGVDVGVNVDKGILDRRSDTSASSHVADPLDVFSFENAFQESSVADVTAVNLDAAFFWVTVFEKLEVGFLNTHIVVSVHFVNDDNIVSTSEKMFGNMTSDETRAAGDKNFLVSDVRFDNLGVGPRSSASRLGDFR